MPSGETRPTLLDVPNDQHIFVVNAANGGQEAILRRESQRVDAHLVHAESLEDAAIRKVPDYDVCLQSLEGFLATGYEFTRVRAGQRGDLVVVAFQEGLRARDDMSDNDRRAEREKKMLVVRVQNKALRHVAWL